MKKKKTFSRVKVWLDYWSEPHLTTRRFVLGLLLITAIPFVGCFVFLVLLLYSLFNSLDRLKKK